MHEKVTCFCCYCYLGVNKNKIIMVVVPNDGARPSATLGFVGLFGTLAGMSGAGLTGDGGGRYDCITTIGPH